MKPKYLRLTRKVINLKYTQYCFSVFWREKQNRFFSILLVALLFFCFRPRGVFPIHIPASVKDLKVPLNGESVLHYANRYAREQDLPIYLFYKARSGQLNNQLISLFNALTIAKATNATLVSPFAFYGPEAFDDFKTGRSWFFFFQSYVQRFVTDPICKRLGVDYNHDQLFGDYFDLELLNKEQPVVSIIPFLKSRGADHLLTFKHVLTRKGDAPYYYSTLKRIHPMGKDVNIRLTYTGEDIISAKETVASRRELDCNFNISTFYRGLPFRAGVNGNFLFLTKLYRTHSLNCTAKDPYWLHIRRYVQPRSDIREMVDESMRRWGTVFTIHLRLFPRDMGRFSTTSFCDHIITHYGDKIFQADHIYVAYSVTSEESVAIVQTLRKQLGESRILTAADYGDLRSRGPRFDMRYIVPIIDMWTAVRSKFFVGRMASSLSWNVIYWREALSLVGYPVNNFFYKLEDFSWKGEKNPSDVFE